MAYIRFRIGSSLFHFRIFAVVGSCALVSTFLALYLILEYTDLYSPSGDFANFQAQASKGESSDHLNRLEKQLAKLETELSQNREAFNEVHAGVMEAVSSVSLGSYHHFSLNYSVPLDPLSPEQCRFGSISQLQPPADIQIISLYERLKFDNPNGGVWKQGWDIQYKSDQWQRSGTKLKVFVVPHSHNDPGWLKTFAKYYKDQTEHILDNVVSKLSIDERRRFIWAEVSFLAAWWEHRGAAPREALRRLAQTGQLELVTGGWVMADEASTHYYALIDQMVEGHLWLKNNLDIEPQNGWAIDPFGLSSTMAYILRRSGLSNMVIQRTHYSLKKYLAQHRSLEFFWTQTWDQNASSAILCHMMPFYSYDIPHTCGPDPRVCCQFDFKRLPGGKVKCPWRVPPVAITDSNVAEKAKLLLDQYRKKSQLFRTNVVLIPLGDDFRYDKPLEWDQQFLNYQKLFDYMNSDPNLYVEAQFGTLHDYFTALHEELKQHKEMGSLEDELNSIQPPTLSGDFFTYADRDDHYWSGYFTSRPFFKNMERFLEAHLRGAEILYSLSLNGEDSERRPWEPPIKELLSSYLQEGRRTLGLFQHHDAITGTAKDHVVLDYASSILRSFQNLRKVIGHSALHLILDQSDDSALNASLPAFELDEVFNSSVNLPEKIVLQLDPQLKRRTLVIYNSLAHARHELVTVHTNSPNVEIVDYFGNIVPSQIAPVFHGQSLQEGIYKLTFRAELPSLSLNIFTLREGFSTPKASLVLFNHEVTPSTQRLFSIHSREAPEEFAIKNPYLTAYFSGADGMLRSVRTHGDSISTNIRINFLKYGTRVKGKDKSGAYLFLPNQDAQSIEYSRPHIRVEEGALVSEVVVFLPHVEHHIRLKNSPGVDGLGLEIYNIVNILQEINKEIIMRLYTNIYTSHYYTDLNGFQMSRRDQYAKIPLQGNVYPIPTMAYLQDNTTRLSLITKHPLGGTSLKPGWLEVFLDRRLNQDDNRGLQQGVTDNRITASHFALLLEHVNLKGDHAKVDGPISHPSLSAHHARLSLLHPPFLLSVLPQVEPRLGALQSSRPLRPFASPSLPCDLHLLNLRSFIIPQHPGATTALFLHRMGHECGYRPYGLVNCTAASSKVSISSLFPRHFLGSPVEEVSLSLLYKGTQFPRDTEITVPPMEVAAFLLH